MSSNFIQLYPANDEDTETTTADLLDLLREKGIRPKVDLSDSSDQITVVCEVAKDLYHSVLKSIEAWGQQNLGRDAEPKTLKLFIDQTEQNCTVTITVHPPAKAAAAIP